MVIERDSRVHRPPPTPMAGLPKNSVTSADMLARGHVRFIDMLAIE